MPLFDKVAIIGVGLIGGSIGIDIKKNGLASQVIGVTTKRQSLKTALRLKAIDKGFLDIGEAVSDADLIILATPINSILKVAPLIARSAKPGAVVIDVGSTKLKIVRAIEKILPENIYFVGTHPLAGSEKRGVSNAQSRLFKNSLCVITPTYKTKLAVLKDVKKFWQRLGAKVKFLSPQEHDRIISLTSHLAHIAAFALIDSIPISYFKFSASGLRDATRLAESDPQIWRDICLSNRRQILKSIQRFQSSLSRLKSLISQNRSKALFDQLRKIKIKRRNLKL